NVADSVMYREALAAAAEARGWFVHWYDRERVFRDAAAALGCEDVEAFLHAMGRPIRPPWQAKHRLAAAARLAAAGHVAPTEALAAPREVVVAGSILGWGAELEDSFDLIVCLVAPAEERIRRLRERELRRRGRVDEEFIAWAAQYDIGAQEGRSLARHLAWLKERRSPVLTLSSVEPVAALVAAIRNTLKAVSRLV